MTQPNDVPLTDAHQEELLRLATQHLQALLTQPSAPTTTTLDSVMRRLFDRDNRELLTVSAFGSAL